MRDAIRAVSGGFFRALCASPVAGLPTSRDAGSGCSQPSENAATSGYGEEKTLLAPLVWTRDANAGGEATR